MDKISLDIDSMFNQQQNSYNKLSITTIYPIELPKIKFYTQRAIHEDPLSQKRSIKQIPINFIKYTKNKQKKRCSSLGQNKHLLLKGNDNLSSFQITNSLEKEKKQRLKTLNIDQFRSKTQPNQNSTCYIPKRQICGILNAKIKEQKSKLVLNYYKRKYLKFRCRKSIDLQKGTQQYLKNSIQNISLLADGLKIEKIEILQTPQIRKEIINKAKFNTISPQNKRYNKFSDISPWNFKTQNQSLYD